MPQNEDAVFKGKAVFLDNTTFNFKEKTELKKIIVDNGGQVSFSLNKKVMQTDLAEKKSEQMRSHTIKMLWIDLDLPGPNLISLAPQIFCVVSKDVLKFKGTSRGETCKKLKIPVQYYF